jgi:peptidyl-prolyl cis-trans isomerase C
VKKSTLHVKKISMLLALIFSTAVMAASASDQVAAPKEASVFAKIGKEIITWQNYKDALGKASRDKFYHAQPSNDVVAELQRTVANQLITDALVLNEANRRKLKPNSEDVKKELEGVERKLANDEQWKQTREQRLPAITKHFQNENLIKKLEGIIRKVPSPTELQIKAYFTNHPDKFTIPTAQRVSLILLGVDPSSTTAEWKQTMEDGKALAQRIRDGADFAEMAKLYSKDEQTVDLGGDMGYLHEGMLPGLPQEIVNKLKVGEVSDPVRLLEGAAIFRLTETKPPELANFDASKQRITELLLAEQSDNAWNSFIADLKKKTPMSIDESRFLPLSGVPTKASASDVPSTTK